MRTYGGVEVQLHRSWPRHYIEVSDQLHILAALPLRKVPSKQLLHINQTTRRHKVAGSSETSVVAYQIKQPQEAAVSSEMLVPAYQTRWRHIS
jgi:hypothetical protein